MHWTLGSLPPSQAVFYTSAFFQSDGVPPSAPAPVTRAVGSSFANKEVAKMAKKVSRRDFLKLAGATSAGLALSACGVQAMEVPTPTSTSTLIPSTQTPTPTSTYIPTATSIPNTLRGYADALGFNIGVVAETNGFNEALISREFNEIAVSSIGWEVIDQKKESAYDFSIPDWYIHKYAAKNHLAVSAMHLVYGLALSEYEYVLPDWLKSGSFSRDELIEIMKKH